MLLPFFSLRRWWRRTTTSSRARQAVLAVEPLGGWLMPEPSQARPAEATHALLSCELLEERIAPASRVWTGAIGDGRASNPGNWQGNVAPVAGDSLLFPIGSAGVCTLDPNFPATIADLTIQPGSAVSVFVGRNLTISNNLSLSSAVGLVEVLMGKTLTAQNVNLSQGARLNGSGTLEVLGNMRLSHTTFQSLRVLIQQAATVEITNNVTFDATEISSTGAVTWTGGTI